MKLLFNILYIKQQQQHQQQYNKTIAFSRSYYNLKFNTTFKKLTKAIITWGSYMSILRKMEN